MMLDDTVEEMTANEAKVAIDSGQSTLHKGPVLSLEMGDISMSVVKVGNSDW